MVCLAESPETLEKCHPTFTGGPGEVGLNYGHLNVLPWVGAIFGR